MHQMHFSISFSALLRQGVSTGCTILRQEFSIKSETVEQRFAFTFVLVWHKIVHVKYQEGFVHFCSEAIIEDII
jgi:hypothetical protein